MLCEPTEKERSEPEHSPSPFFIIPEDSDSTFRVAINYFQLSKIQAASIQSILIHYRDHNRCYISDSEEVSDDGESILSLAFNERRAAERLLHVLERALSKKSVEVLESGHVHQRDTTIGTQIIGGSYYDHPILKDDSYQAEKETQANRKKQTANVLSAGYWRLPLSNKEYYIERKAVTTVMRAHFKKEISSSDSKAKPIKTVVLSALYGLGGIGKTEIAIDYIIRSEGYTFRCWFDACHLDADYRQFAIELGLMHPKEKIDEAEIRTRVRQWFASHPGWLVVYDNAETLSDLTPYLPRTGGNVLITSRNAVSPWHSLGLSIPVDLMTEAEAVTLLEKKMSKSDAGSAELAKVLGYLPLALAQAAAYIRQKGCDVTGYLARYAEAQVKLLAKNWLDEDDVSRDKAKNPKPHATVMTTWTMNFEAIEELETEISQQAMTLLNGCAYLAPSIANRLLLSLLGLKADVLGEMALDDVKTLLRSYSLIDHRRADEVRVHELVQFVIRKRQSMEDGWHFLERATDVVQLDYIKDRESIADYHKASLMPHYKVLKSHLDQILVSSEEAHLEETCLSVKKVLGGLLSELGILCGDGNQRRDSKRYHLRALEIFKEVYGKYSSEVAGILNNLGVTCNFLREPDIGKDYLLEALDIYKEIYGESHPEVAVTMSNLGLVYYSLNNYDDSKWYYSESLEIFRRDHDGHDSRVAITLGNLSLVCRSLKKYKDAKSYRLQALEMLEEMYGSWNPLVASALGNLAVICALMHDHVNAMVYQFRALDIFKKVYGECHLDVAGSLNNLGITFHALKKYDEAKKYQIEALSILQTICGDEDVSLIRVIENLGLACYALGEYREANEYLLQVLSLKKKFYGERHLILARTLEQLSLTSNALGRPGDSRDYLLQALEIYDEFNSGPYPEKLTALLQLANISCELKQNLNVKNYLTQALEIYERFYGGSHPMKLNTLKLLGAVCSEMKDYATAIAYQLQVLEIKRETYGEHHSEVAQTLRMISDEFHKSGDYFQAINYDLHALKIYNEIYKEPHYLTAASYERLGELCQQVGDYVSERDNRVKFLELFKKLHGEWHPKVADVLRRLGHISGLLCDYVTATAYQLQAIEIYKRVYNRNHPHVAQTLMDLGLTCRCAEDYLAAKGYLLDALEIFEVNGDKSSGFFLLTLNALSKTLFDLDDLDDVKKYLLQALEINRDIYGEYDSDLIGILFKLGNKYMYSGEIDQTIVHYEAYIAWAKDPSVAYHNLASCYHMQGSIEQAEFYFQLAVAERPQANVHAEYGHFLFQQKAYEKAMTQLMLALEYKGDGSGLWYSKHEIAVIESHLSDYIAIYGELTISPELLADYLLVLCYHRLSKDVELAIALETLETRLLSSENPCILDYYLLGSIYDVLSDSEQSSKYFELAWECYARKIEVCEVKVALCDEGEEGESVIVEDDSLSDEEIVYVPKKKNEERSTVSALLTATDLWSSGDKSDFDEASKNSDVTSSSDEDDESLASARLD